MAMVKAAASIIMSRDDVWPVALASSANAAAVYHAASEVQSIPAKRRSPAGARSVHGNCRSRELLEGVKQNQTLPAASLKLILMRMRVFLRGDSLTLCRTAFVGHRWADCGSTELAQRWEPS
jgi:hypothetical protein